jgi:SulP family sulfate permease
MPMVPKIITTLREGYHLADLRKDIIAGLTVAVVALPLSMAIAVASGVGPERGLYSAIVGGFLVSALGGSRFQIGGPAGAFIVLVSGSVLQFGVSGMLLAVFLSGLLLALAGVLRLGELIRRVPHAVTVGFTAGIAVVILASQLKDLLGLHLDVAEPGHIIPKIRVLAGVIGTINPFAPCVAAVVVLTILAQRRWAPALPGMLLAVGLVSLGAWALNLPVETVASRFGEIPRTLPAPSLPRLELAAILPLLPTVLAFTLLGSIESLLSAVVADRMTERRHKPNIELVAQGLANIGAALFGGLPVTGTIARTATNVRAGARSPISGMLHAAFLLVFMVVAAPLVGYIPLAALAGVLVVVAWNMVEIPEFRRLLGEWRTALVLVATLGLTVIEDLTFGIAAGCGLATAFWAWERWRARGGARPPAGPGVEGD